ncbi:MAG: hypothetical protein ACI80F_001994, partial [Natronomonas sp.]
MDEITLGVPQPLLDSLPEDGSGAAQDMQRAVGGYEQRINRLIEEADGDSEAAGAILDIIEHFETRGERFDEFVPEL